METMSCEELLRRRDLTSFTQASVFGALSEASILWLLQHGEILAAGEDENLFDQGEAGNSFHVILEGRVSYYKYRAGRYGFIRHYTPGEQIGFMSLIALHERVGRATAHDGTVTVRIDSTLFHAFHEHNPMDFGILMMNLAREMARSLRAADDLVVATGKSSTPQ